MLQSPVTAKQAACDRLLGYERNLGWLDVSPTSPRMQIDAGSTPPKHEVQSLPLRC